MQNTEERVRGLLLILMWILAGISLILMSGCVFLQVFTRYIFHFSYSWPEELARFSFIWTSLLGACLALEQKKLHEIDVIFNLFPANVKPIVSLCAHLMICGFLSVLLIYGIKLTKMVHIQSSPAMEIPMSYVYSAVPFASAVMLISYVFETINRVYEISFKKENRS